MKEEAQEYGTCPFHGNCELELKFMHPCEYVHYKQCIRYKTRQRVIRNRMIIEKINERFANKTPSSMEDIPHKEGGKPNEELHCEKER